MPEVFFCDLGVLSASAVGFLIILGTSASAVRRYSERRRLASRTYMSTPSASCFFEIRS